MGETKGQVNYNQFTEIWGLEKLDVEKLQKKTTIDTLCIRKININTVSIEILRNKQISMHRANGRVYKGSRTKMVLKEIR